MGEMSEMPMPEIPLHRRELRVGGGDGGGRRGRDGGRGDDMEDQTPIPPIAPDERGTGVLLLAGSAGSNKRTIVDVTHAELLSNGRNLSALAVKWITPRLASREEVLSARCGPVGLVCAGSCVVPGCICHPERRVCE